MATPIRHLPSAPQSTPTDLSSVPDLDDVFFTWLARLAVLPIRRGGDKVLGLVRDDGLTAATLRALAIRWCQAELQRGRFDRDELRGLALALIQFTDGELRGMIEGAVIVYGVNVR